MIMGYRHGAHTVFEIHLHLVWTTKFRKGILRGEVGIRARELIRQMCREVDVEIMKGHVSKDHIHLICIDPTTIDDQPVGAETEGEDVV